MRARITIFKVLLIVIWLLPVHSWAQEETGNVWLSIFFTGTINATMYWETEPIFQIGDAVTGDLLLAGPGYPVYSFLDQRWKVYFSQPPQLLLKNNATGAAYDVSSGPQWAEGGGQTTVEYLVHEGAGKQFLLKWGYEYLDYGQADSGWSVCGAAFTPEAVYTADWTLVEWWRWGPDATQIIVGSLGEGIHVLVDDCTCMEGYMCNQDPVQWPNGPPDEAGLVALILRLYQQLWLEDPAQGNVDYWRINMLNGTETVQDLLDLLMGDGRYQGRNLNDQEFLETIYEALFGKDIPGDDLLGWLDDLAAGAKSRDEILREILLSDAFQGRCARLGITATPGNI